MGQFSYNPLNGNLDFSSNGLEAGTLEFMGNISVASDFPTSAQVQENDIYRVLAGVTDNDVTKTNTGQTFVAGDEIMWDGAGWDLLGNYVSLLGTNNTWTGTNSFDDVNVGGTFLFTGSGTNTLATNTADGADDKAIVLAGGGAYGPTRGSGVAVIGNEYAAIGGDLELMAGDSATSGAIKHYVGNGAGGAYLALKTERITGLTTFYGGIDVATSATTGYGMYVQASSLTSGSGAYIYSNSSDITSRYLTYIHNDHASAVGTTSLYVRNDSTNAVATFVGSATTNPAVFIQADSLTTGAALYVYSNSADSTGRALFSLINDNASATGTTCFAIQQDANATGLLITGSNTTQTALQVNVSSLTTGRGAYIYSNSSSTSQFVLLDLTNANASATGMIPLAIANLSPTSTNYFRMVYLGGNSGGNYIWKANGVTPNGNLTGATGDICIGADSGKAYYCTSGTSWTAM